MSGFRRYHIAAALAAFFLSGSSAGYSQSDAAVQKQSRRTESATTTSRAVVAEVPEKAASKLIVYYFHGDTRCTNCINFQNYTEEVLRSTFAEQVRNGTMEWKIVNTDKRGNEHFMQDYRLFTKSLVLVEEKDGKQLRYKNLAEIWQTVGNKKKFQEYVRGEIQSFPATR